MHNNDHYKLNRLKKIIQRYDVISFDIFDTLLCRPYMKPTDAFLHLEELESKKGFAEERIAAEIRARKKQPDYSEITIDEIYDEIKPAYKLLKQKELELEAKILYANPKMKEIYDYTLFLGKKIIIISDMYLKTEFLEQVLEINGFSGYEKIYVSSQYRKNKHTCELFKYALNDLSLKPNQVLHIGDNHHADYRMAKYCSIEAFHYTKISDEFFSHRSNLRLKKLYEQNQNSLCISIILGLIIKNYLLSKERVNYWQALGYNWGGPAVYAFTKYIQNEINKQGLKEALFIARDGYTIEKTFNALQKGDIKTHYIYGPRLINIVTNFDQDNKPKNEKHIKMIISYYIELSKELKERSKKKPDREIFSEKFLYENLDIIEPLRLKEISDYKNYLKKFDINQKTLALIDLAAESFNSLTLLTKMLPENEILGLYWKITMPEIPESYKCKDFRDSHIKRKKKSQILDFIHYDFMEFLITAPEYPIKTIKNGEVIYIENKKEEVRKNVYKYISEHEIKFVKDLIETFGEYQIEFNHTDMVRFIDTFLKYPSVKDSIKMSKIHHSCGAEHKEYKPLMAYKKNFISPVDIIRINFKDLLKKIKLSTFIFKYYV